MPELIRTEVNPERKTGMETGCARARYLGVLTLVLLMFPAAAEPVTSVEGVVLSLGQHFGNLNTDIPMAALPLELGESFVVNCNSHSEMATLAADYADVHAGDWLGIENAEGHLQLAISFGDAANTLGCRVGDSVTIEF